MGVPQRQPRERPPRPPIRQPTIPQRIHDGTQPSLELPRSASRLRSHPPPSFKGADHLHPTLPARGGGEGGGANLIPIISRPPGSCARGQHHDFGADRRALIEVDDILIDHADTPGRDTLADRPGFDGAVNAKERILVALPQVKCAGAEWVARTAMHAQPALQLAHHSPDLGLALDHLFRWIPVGPFLLVVDGGDARPVESAPTNADAIANGAPAPFDQVEEMRLRIDHDGAGLLVRGVINGTAEIGRIDVRQSKGRNRKGFAVALRVNRRIRDIRAAEEWPCRLALSVRYRRPLPAWLGARWAEKEETVLLGRGAFSAQHGDGGNAEEGLVGARKPPRALAKQDGHFRRLLMR